MLRFFVKDMRLLINGSSAFIIFCYVLGFSVFSVEYTALLTAFVLIWSVFYHENHYGLHRIFFGLSIPRRLIVISRYIELPLCTFLFFAISVGVAVMIGSDRVSILSWGGLEVAMIFLFLIGAIYLPMLFVYRNLLNQIFIIFILFMFPLSFFHSGREWVHQSFDKMTGMPLLGGVGVLISILAYVISYFVAVRLYKKQEY